jgi:NADPH2 dehydrogenase
MSTSALFTPLKLGNLRLQHRIAMAPMTRNRASDAHVPTEMMATYYAQRASTPGTLLITEATLISHSAGGLDNVPGIYTADQIAAWRKVTDAVHAKGSFIFCQLWHLGRAAEAHVAEREGIRVRGPSAIAIPTPSYTGAAFTVPEPLSADEIKAIVADYAAAARNAIAAGFDGVEIHAANGYLIDQFLQDVSNVRTDLYGGSIENRSRLAVEVVDAVAAAVGPERTGIRLSPWSDFYGMRMADPVPQFSDLIVRIRDKGLAYLHLVQWITFQPNGARDAPEGMEIDFAVRLWEQQRGVVLVAGRLTAESAKGLVDEKWKGKDVVAVFGRHFTSTPDLPFRVKEGIEFTGFDVGTLFTPKEEKGYVDQVFSKEFEARVGETEVAA